jgi:ABC-type Zn uptake system ZnuABC Zn-binding protein ZnuA
MACAQIAKKLSYRMMRKIISVGLLIVLLLSACSASPRNDKTGPSATSGLHVLAAESFLADIAQNVAGSRLTVEALIPVDVDPHTFQPTPAEVAIVAQADVLILNGAGLETFIAPLLKNVGSGKLVIQASTGLSAQADPQAEHPQGDPHFWLDPNNVVTYVENIRDGLSQADPGGAQVYAANAAAYIEQLKSLDTWIKGQVSQIPPDSRLMVTDHEEFGYFAERYGFKLVGAVVPSLSSEAQPSAQQMAALIDQIKATGAPAIFLETSANPKLADQVAAETGAKIVADLYTHSLSGPDGPAPTYIDMIKYDVIQIVDALVQ